MPAAGIEDQQIGGLIMWIPAGLVYIAAGLALFAGWLRESEARARSFGLTVTSGVNSAAHSTAVERVS